MRIMKTLLWLPMLCSALLAGCGGGDSDSTSETPTTPITAFVPAAPDNISAAEGKGRVSINWSEVVDATSYNIYYGSAAGVTAANGTKVTNAVAPQIISGLTDGTRYYFVVTALNAAGESIKSSEVSARPAANKALAAGYYHSVAVHVDGYVYAWGGNDEGQLGDGTTTEHHLPTQVNGLTDVVAVEAGGNHTLALKSDGTVWAWGDNWVGQLGTGSADFALHAAAERVNGLEGVMAIAAGNNHSVALKSDGTVWTWGENLRGQLGTGTTNRTYSPVQVVNLTGVAAIATGEHHTLALKHDGTVWAWGLNFYGALGDGTQVEYSVTPVQALNLTNIVAIAAGDVHSLALKADGTMWSWGSNTLEQLGLGDSDYEYHVPTQYWTDVSLVAAAGDATFVVKTDGSSWSWGENAWGELGYETTSPASGIPNQIGHTWSAVASSHGDHVLALKPDGTLWSWGYNYNGQLGWGTSDSNQLNLPAQVFGLTM